MLLSGSNPFWGPVRDMPWNQRRKIMVDRIMRCEYKRMEHGVWDSISQEAKAFVRSLLQIDPHKRPSTAKALRSPWMKEKRKPEEPLTINAAPSADSVGTPQHDKRRKKLAIRLLAQKMSSDEIAKLQEAFQKYDPDNQGMIGVQDFHSELMKTGKWTEEELSSALSDFVSKPICIYANAMTFHFWFSLTCILSIQSRFQIEGR